MKALLTSVAVLAAAAMMLTTAATSQTAGSGQANPPAASGPSGAGAGPGPGSGPGYGPRGHGWGRGMMMGPGMMGMGGMGGMCDPRGAGLAEWRMERIERLITPNDAQRAALDNLRNASTKAAEIVAAACPREFPASATGRLELMEKRLDAMQQAIRTVRPAFDAFYATLNEEQKARVNTSGPRHWGWHGWSRGG
jgi:LTXXQ motif family protein